MSWFPEQRGSGLDRYYYGLTEAFRDAGVSHAGLVAGTADVARQTDRRIQAFAEPSAPLLVRWREMRMAFRRQIALQHAVVASHFAPYAFPVRKSLARLPHVVHFHGPWADESRVEGAGRLATLVKQHVEKSVYRTADRYITLSHAFARILVERYGADEAKVRVVPGGVDVVHFATSVGGDAANSCPRGSSAPSDDANCAGRLPAGKPLLSRQAARERLGWPVDRPVVFCVRRLARRMGLENLVAAVAAVRPSHPDLLVVIGGSGHLRDELAARIDQLGLGQHVRLAGFVPEEQLPLAFRAADFSIVPTQALEGFGLVVLESLAAGTPALVTPVGGLPEVLAGFGEQLVLASSSAESIAAGLRGGLDGSLPLPTGERCQAYVGAHFAWPVISRRVLAVYDEATA